MSVVSVETRRAVILRDQCWCVCCGLAVAYDNGDRIKPVAEFSIHHRRARKMGGTPDPAYNKPPNLLTLCGSGDTGCHGYVESHRAWSLQRGLLVPDWEDPETVPVIVATLLGDRAYLLIDDTRILVPTGEAA